MSHRPCQDDNCDVYDICCSLVNLVIIPWTVLSMTGSMHPEFDWHLKCYSKGCMTTCSWDEISAGIKYDANWRKWLLRRNPQYHQIAEEIKQLGKKSQSLSCGQLCHQHTGWHITCAEIPILIFLSSAGIDTTPVDVNMGSCNLSNSHNTIERQVVLSWKEHL